MVGCRRRLDGLLEEMEFTTTIWPSQPFWGIVPAARHPQQSGRVLAGKRGSPNRHEWGRTVPQWRWANAGIGSVACFPLWTKLWR